MPPPAATRVYVLSQPFVQRTGDTIVILWREIARATTLATIEAHIEARGLKQFGHSGYRLGLAEPDAPEPTPLLPEPEPPRIPEHGERRRWRQLELRFD